MNEDIIEVAQPDEHDCIFAEKTLWKVVAPKVKKGEHWVQTVDMSYKTTPLTIMHKEITAFYDDYDGVEVLHRRFKHRIQELWRQIYDLNQDYKAICFSSIYFMKYETFKRRWLIREWSNKGVDYNEWNY